VEEANNVICIFPPQHRVSSSDFANTDHHVHIQPFRYLCDQNCSSFQCTYMIKLYVHSPKLLSIPMAHQDLLGNLDIWWQRGLEVV